MSNIFHSTCILALTAIYSNLCLADGLTLNGTRLIYDATKKEASIMLANRGRSVPHLVQAWVSDVNSHTEKIPFITTPPLSKLGQDSATPVRVVNISTENDILPGDRESLFLLHIRAVPATEKKEKPQRMTVAIQHTIKLIYRPVGFSGKEATLAIDKVVVSAVDTGVNFYNPTPYVVTLTNVFMNGNKVERPGVVMPFSSLAIAFTSEKPNEITFSSINDFGGMTPTRKVNL